MSRSRHALQKYITTHFDNVENEIIDFQPESQQQQYAIFRKIHSKKDILRNLISFWHYKALSKRFLAFSEMREKYLKMTKRCTTTEEAIKIAGNYDLVIAGSDQIWNTTARDFSEAFFLPGISKKSVHEYLVNGGKSCMAGFVLKNTLSDNGGVTRGICKMDENGNLTEVVETKNIVKTADGAEADAVAVDVNSLVSMNMWGLTPDFLDVLENGFKEFFEKEVPGNPQKAEYLIPIFIGELLEQGKMSVKVLKTNDTWYGMTYHEDVAAVKNSFKKMLADGVYKADLFSDL